MRDILGDMAALASGLPGRAAVGVARETYRAVVPVAFVLVNAVVFALVRPGVPDLWAARARAAAVEDDVGLTYWFGWFGGSAPGRYSVLTPPVSALLGSEVVAGIAAVAIAGTAVPLLRATRRPTAGAWAAAVAVVVNLWCGRVPFLLGAAFAVAAILLVRRQRGWPAGGLAVLSALASPVAGAFLCLALSGVLLARPTGAHRRAILPAVAGALGTLAAIAVAFGPPGPQPFPPYLLAEIVAALLLMLLTGPPAHLRLTLAVTAVAAVLVFLVPNGLGANLARLALFCLPPAAVALSPRRPVILAALMAPILVFGALTCVTALRSAVRPSSEASYYAPLAARLDTLPAISHYRLELVGATRAAYAALLDHAVLARGWETQTDRALNSELLDGDVDAPEYRRWLDDNAVGYVAVNVRGRAGPEERLTQTRPDYLREIWRDARWRLYEVESPTPIVAGPAVRVASTQAELRVHVPCACRILVRVRWSRFLTVSPVLPGDAPAGVEAAHRSDLDRDDSGWTVLTTDRAGTFVLAGLL